MLCSKCGSEVKAGSKFCIKCGNRLEILCSKCGKEIKTDANFCEHCGNSIQGDIKQETPTPITGQQITPIQQSSESTSSSGITDEEYYSFIGKNAAKYLMKFKSFGTGGFDSFKATWHWPAFFVPAFWLLYRKLYVWALIVFIVPLIINFFLPPILFPSSLPLALLFSFIVGIGTSIAMGLSANYIYYKYTKKKIAEIKKNVWESRQAIAYVRSGGVNTVAVWIAIILIGGISAAIMIPQFIQYEKRGYDSTLNTDSENAYTASVEQGAGPAANDDMRNFVAVVLAETEDVWKDAFQRAGKTYQKPKLDLFLGAVESVCGMAGSATGPFYCPGDQKVYLDLTFFEELGSRFGASGDFAQGYVIAHEVGHHVQNQLGIIPKVHELQSTMSTSEKNKLNVMLELQADCLAGIWAHHTKKNRHVLKEGDIEEALNAASSVGDDRIQKQTQGYVVPDGFTHGSSAQRVSWFKRGLEQGNFNSCDTFKASHL